MVIPVSLICTVGDNYSDMASSHLILVPPPSPCKHPLYGVTGDAEKLSSRTLFLDQHKKVVTV